MLRISVSIFTAVSYFTPARDVFMVSTLAVSKPGFTLFKATKVRISSAAPISSTSDNAISATTSTLRVSCRRASRTATAAASTADACAIPGRSPFIRALS